MLAKGIEILDCASERAGDAAVPRWPALLSLYGIVLLAGFGGSYAIQILNLGLQQRGLSGSAIGLSTATQALGIVIAACLAVPVLNRLGSARTLALGSLIAGFALAAAALVESIEAVTIARFVCALGIGTLSPTSNMSSSPGCPPSAGRPRSPSTPRSLPSARRWRRRPSPFSAATACRRASSAGRASSSRRCSSSRPRCADASMRNPP
jgi:MFS family permease